MNEDLKKIKKYYGESMMHLCRELFPTILETEGLLISILEKKFFFKRFLYQDITINQKKISEFVSFINHQVNVEEKTEIDTNQSAKDLLKLAGYTLYECHTEEEIQAFKKYYRSDEELCTFRNQRLKNHHVFFAVKDNVESITRSEIPKRQDEYGTSVISIQFSKGEKNFISIKNRYNHNVVNPDATFSNNLEKIIPGLTIAFEREYKLNINRTSSYFSLDNYIETYEGQFFKYNIETNNRFFCPENIMIENGLPKEYDKNKFILIEDHLFNLESKSIICLSGLTKDTALINAIGKVESINIVTNKENKIITIINKRNEETIIKINHLNCITEFTNNSVKEIQDNFLRENKYIEYISLASVEKIGADFLKKNNSLKSITLENCVDIESHFMSENESLESINLPEVINIESSFLVKNNKVTKINFPKLRFIDKHFFHQNTIINEVNLPSVEFIEHFFMCNNQSLKVVELPKVEEVGSYFMDKSNIKAFKAPELISVDYAFLRNNLKLEELYLPNLEIVEHDFLQNNENLKVLILPSLRSAKPYFLYRNEILETVLLPKLESAGHGFLHSAHNIKLIYMPLLESIDKTADINSNHLLNRELSLSDLAKVKKLIVN